MTDLGIIKPAMVGCFHFLPLGIRAIDKLSKLVQEEMESIEAQKISMPFLSSTDLWLRTGTVLISPNFCVHLKHFLLTTASSKYHCVAQN